MQRLCFLLIVLISVVFITLTDATLESQESIPGVWFGPNMTSRDFLEIFSTNGAPKWEKARQYITGFKFQNANVYPYGGETPASRNWRNLDRYPTSLLENNILPNFVDVRAFQQLKAWHIKIAIEGGAVKPGSPERCSGFGEVPVAVRAVEAVRANGGEVDYYSLDEPMIGGIGYWKDAWTINTVTCNPNPTERDARGNIRKEDMERVVMATINFYREFDRLVNRPGTRQVSIVHMEPFPHYKGPELMRYFDMIRSDDSVRKLLVEVKIDLDFDHARRTWGDNWQSWVLQEMAQLKKFFNARGIRFGIIFAGPDGVDEQGHFRYVMQNARAMEGFKVDSYTFQSWAKADPDNPQSPDFWKGLVPRNLADDEKFSHTYLIRQALRRLLAK